MFSFPTKSSFLPAKKPRNVFLDPLVTVLPAELPTNVFSDPVRFKPLEPLPASEPIYTLCVPDTQYSPALSPINVLLNSPVKPILVLAFVLIESLILNRHLNPLKYYHVQ